MTSQSEAPEVSFLMPCLNEEATLGRCISEAREWLERTCHGTGYEIIVADNGSADNSVQIAIDGGARVVHVSEKGYGAALRGGIEAAGGKFVIMGDSDLSYDFSCLPVMVDRLRKGADLVMGNRFLGGIDPGAMPPLHRYLGNPVLSFLGRLFFGVDVGDFHCGMRGFRREAILEIDLQSTGMEFASEMIVKSALARKKIEEVPTRLRKDGRGRKPHLNTWKDGWRHLRFLLLFCPTWLFTIPGLLLMAAGGVLTLLVWPAPTTLSGWWGHFVLDVNTLVYAALFLTGGFQLVSTGAFVKVFSRSHGLLPAGRPTFFEKFSLEWGVAVGVVLFVLGVFGSLVAGLEWSEGGYVNLNPRETLRLVVPSATAFTLGIQMSITSFLVGVAGLVKK
jgi:glycosyltransferase involved in cell wall biosynthesis